MVQITALACPVCGAPLNARSENCDFCGSFLLIHVDTLGFNRANLKQTIIREQIATFRSRLRTDSLDVEARHGLGVAYFNLGLIEEAAEELEAAARLLPENAEIQAQAAVVLRERLVQGDSTALGRLKARVDAATALDPDNYDALTIRAELMANEGRTAEAHAILARIESLEDENPDRDPAHARQRVTAVLVAEALNADDWPRARPLLLDLPDDRASSLMSSYLLRKTVSGDRLLVVRKRLTNVRRLTFWLPIIGIIGALVIWRVATAMESSNFGPAILIVGLAAIVLIEYSLIRLALSELAASAVHVSRSEIRDPATPPQTLIQVADGLNEARSGPRIALANGDQLSFLGLFRAQLASISARSS